MRRGKLLVLFGAVLLAAIVMLPSVVMAQGAGEPEIDDGSSLVNASFFEIAVVRGGPVAWILIGASVCMFAMVIDHFVKIRQTTLIPDEIVMQVQGLFEERRYREALDYTASDPTFIGYIIHEGLAEAANGYAAMQRSMQEAADDRTAQLYRKIELLNVLGAISPMFGLFGTVTGMLLTFYDIAKFSVEHGSMPPPHILSGGIFMALLTTAWGLFVAIPALSVYGVMRNRIDQCSAQAQLKALELLKNFKPGARPNARPQAKPAVKPAVKPAN